MGEQETIALWAARPGLTAPQWESLYASLRAHCAGERGLDPDGQSSDRFDSFFLRRVVQATPSALPSVACVSSYFRWFDDLVNRDATLATACQQLETRSVVSRSPSLHELEDAIFRTSDAYCVELARRIAAGDLDVSAVDDADLAVRVCQLVEAMRRPASLATGVAAPMPHELAAYLDRKAAAEAYEFHNVPVPGQIVRIDVLVGPDGPMAEDLARPLHALIDVPTDVDGVWWGWMVGAEPDYACEWDFVLEESDAPRDPMAAVVQLWNPVRINLPTVACVAGELTADRMRALHSLVADFLSGNGTPLAEVDDRSAANGFLMRRKTVEGYEVLTGHPLGDETDVRQVYQTMYENAADVLQQTARLAAKVSLAASWLHQAHVLQTGVNRFVATAAHDPLLSLEVEFQFPGTRPSVCLTQQRDRQRHDAALTVLGESIEFNGGVAFPSADVAAKVATVMHLPDAFAHWSKVGAEFARSGRTTTGRTRQALQGIVDAAIAAAVAPANVFRFLFVPYGALRAGVARAEEGSVAASTPVVARIESIGSERGRLYLLWPGPMPTIASVEILSRGMPLEPAPALNWGHDIETVEVTGLTMNIDAAARVQIRGDILQIDIG